MRLPTLRYHAAASVAEAARLLADAGPRAALLAGGTDLLPNMKRRQQSPELLVGIRRIGELSRLDFKKDGLHLGGCLTLARVAADPRIRNDHRALFRAAAQVATPQLRAMGTLGGNLCLDTRCNYYDQSLPWRKAIDFCMKAPASSRGRAVTAANDTTCWVAPSGSRCWAVSSSDTAPALIALGARVTLSSPAGERQLPLEALYADDGMAYLTKTPGEVLTRIQVPPAQPGRISTYWKLRRRDSFDFPVLGVAAALKIGKGGVVEEASLVLGAVASRPLPARDAAALLVGRALTDDAIQEAAEKASELAKPLDNTDFALGWRKKVARQYVAGVLKELRGDPPETLSPLGRHAARPLPVLAGL